MPHLADVLTKHVTLSKKKLEYTISCFKSFTTTRNQILLKKGEVANYIYFVEKGSLRIFVTDEIGNEYTRLLILEGMEGTAFPSFIKRIPSTASIQCIGNCKILRLSYQNRELLFEKVPEMETYYRITLEHAYVESIQRIESLISLNSLERYQQLMKEKPYLIQQIPSTIIAEYLGITKETLSRLKSKK